MLSGKSINLNRTIGGASVGSKATSSAADKASRTALRGNTTKPIPSPSRVSTNNPSRSTIHPGSRAGLNDSKTTWIAMHNTGYLNPANQNARLRSRTTQVNTSIQNRNVNQKIHSTVSDSRLTSSKTSSISLMSKR